MDEPSSFAVWTLFDGATFMLACDGFGSYAATEKNRHWLEGFLFGAAFGTFGVIVAACMPTMGTPGWQSTKRDEDEDEHVDVSAAFAAKPPPIVPHPLRRLLGEVEEPKPRRPRTGE
jgi:hypothetical protein